MKADELPMRGLGDARLAIHAAGSLPAWLWSIDGTRILWANPVGVRLFAARRATDLNAKTFGPADAHRRQIAHLAGHLRADGPPRLERLRGFGAPLGRLITCGCTRLTLAGGSEAVLIVAVEPVGRAMPLSERLQRLVEDADIPLAAFGRDGVYVGASQAARALLGFRNLSEAGLDGAREDALKTGRTKTPIGLGHLVLQRVGSGADVGLIALLEPGAVPMPRVQSSPSSIVAPSAADDAPADLTLTDEFSDEFALEPFPEFATQTESASPAADEPEVPPRTTPLRFVWDIDANEHFRIGSDELLSLVGPQAAATLDAPWQGVASAYTSYGRMASAIASRAAWSGISLALPADAADEPLIADLSGIPLYEDGEFSGYRGFGVVSDLETLTRIETLRRRETDVGLAPQSLSAHTPSPALAMARDDIQEFKPAESEMPSETSLFSDASLFSETSPASVDHPPNVVHLRASAEGRAPVLTPVENNAFNELARELSARLEADHAAGIAADDTDVMSVFEDAAPAPAGARSTDAGARALLDLAPVPMAVHRDSRVLYANAAFLAATGHADLAALQTTAFDARSVELARHIALDWDGAAAQGLIVNPAPPAVETGQPEARAADIEDLKAILDAVDEAILIIDARGTIRACNRSASKLFGTPRDALVGRDLATLFTPDTQAAIIPLLERLVASSHAQTVEARTSTNGIESPLKLTLGRAGLGGRNVYAIVRDITSLNRGEIDLAQARRQTERVSADKADILVRISHEMRAPLTAIIGFADVMIEQRFGPLGSDRYADYLRDIRGCGERVVAIVDDLLDLSRIESGKRDLAPAPHDLNEVVEQCVAAMQPQANRERIIIRSSLAHPLPQIVADGAALRQIALNLIGNSIHLANPGGQVIVSTVRTDAGDVLLRVRDTGHGLNDNEMATALAPFRPAAEDADAPALIRLSLTRALAEANHARFTVKPAPYAGTLIEVAFSPAQSGLHSAPEIR